MEADSLRTSNDANCDPRSRRCELAQRPCRVAESEVRQVAVRYSEQARQQGVPAALVAQQLRAPARTVRHWKRQGAGTIALRGRRPKTSSVSERNEVIRFLHEVSGPVVGLEALRALFGGIPRCILENLLRRYRRVWRWRYQQKGFRLTWLQPGSTWAMDFSEPLYPIDGIYPYLFAVRDLASHCQLAWCPFTGETALETIHVLVELFRRYGPPLVLKSDNGSAFIAETLSAFLRDWGVSQLFSPPRHPQYNGALERSNATLKTFTHQHAISAGHPFRWTSVDVERARELANTLTRPWGHRGASPEEAWQARTLITVEEREMFLATAARQRVEAASELTADAAQDLGRKMQAAIDRRALSQTLQELDYLELTRVTRPPKKPKRRSRAELAERARRHGVPLSIANRLTKTHDAIARRSSRADVAPSAQSSHENSNGRHSRMDNCGGAPDCEPLPVLSTARLTASKTRGASRKKWRASLAMQEASARMPEQSDVGAPRLPAPASQAAHGERSNTSWLRRCITLLIRFAKVANISWV